MRGLENRSRSALRYAATSGAGKRQVCGGLRPPLVQPCPARVVGGGVGHRRVSADRPGVGQQRVAAVEQPQLALLERLHVLGQGRAGVVPARPPGREPSAEHPLAERLGDHRGAVRRADGLGHRAQILGRGLGRDAVDHRRDGRDGLGHPGGERRVDELRQVADDAGRDRAVVRQVVAGDERDRPGVRAAPGGEAREQPGRSGAHQRTRVGSQRFHVGSDLGALAVEAPVAAPEVARLGDGDRDRAHLRGSDVPEPGIMVGRRMRAREAAHDLEAIPVAGPGHQRVQALLGIERIRQPRAATGERGDSPVLGVGRALGVPGLVRAEEVPEPEMHEPDRRRDPATTAATRQAAAGAHSLNTLRPYVFASEQSPAPARATFAA